MVGRGDSDLSKAAPNGHSQTAQKETDCKEPELCFDSCLGFIYAMCTQDMRAQLVGCWCWLVAFYTRWFVPKQIILLFFQPYSEKPLVESQWRKEEEEIRNQDRALIQHLGYIHTHFRDISVNVYSIGNNNNNNTEKIYFFSYEKFRCRHARDLELKKRPTFRSVYFFFLNNKTNNRKKERSTTGFWTV